MFCPSVAGAQTNTVTLAGVVTDDTGGALPGATVTASNVATGLVRTATTDSAGRYTVLGLPPGPYDVRAELQAFVTVVQRAQQFQVGQTVALDFKLKIGAVSETVEVTAESPVVQTDSNALTRVVRTEEVDRLPSLTRDFTQLATLSPGVTVSANNVTIGNGPTNGTGFQVDGTSMQAPTLGGAAIPLVQDWIQEFSVLSSQFPAEFGAAQNGVINAVTRSGTNRTEGRVSGYFQDDALNAQLWNATTKAPFGQQRTGVQVGGPLVKDRLLYFAGYEFNHSLTNVPVSISPIFVNVVTGRVAQRRRHAGRGHGQSGHGHPLDHREGGLSRGAGSYRDAAGHRPQFRSVRQRLGDGDERATDRLARSAVSTERFVPGGVDVGDVVLLAPRQPGGVSAQSHSERLFCRPDSFWMVHLTDRDQYADDRVSLRRADARLQWPVGRRLRGGVVRE